ncbi:MAG: glycoside hydrolase family 88 protein [Tidjanibacter sp.]|nr:glycoside hydrolase family 88 protein [Tidjanibacter sp.]MBR3853403.1 glycoside hydrolase family 88 protein [Tidjanibacter sp.]
MKKTVLSVLALLALLCGSCDRDAKLVEENIANAEVQLSALLAQSLEGEQVRIPSSYRDGQVRFVPTRDWVSGFFAGSLWYMYELTGEEKWAEAARTHTEHLHDIQYLTGHHDVGFMINSSYCNGRRLKHLTEPYDTIIVNAAKSLCTRFRPEAGVLQSWNVDRGWQAKRGWACPVIIDNMMNLELLFKASLISGDDTFRNIAISHADKTIEHHYRPDYSTWHVVDYDPATGAIRGKYTAQGAADESAWARGQAWSLYGYTMAYRFVRDERYLQQAENVVKFLFAHPNMPADLVPYWDFDAPNIPNEPRDVSSAAIIASALYELYGFTLNGEYKELADKILVSLSSPAYRAAQGENGGFLLMHSVGSIPHNSSIDVPLNYADYYFLEALVRKQNVENGQVVVDL